MRIQLSNGRGTKHRQFSSGYSFNMKTESENLIISLRSRVISFMSCKADKIQFQSNKFETYFELIVKLLSYLGITINLNGDRRVEKSGICGRIPLPICSFLLLGTLSVAAEYFYIRDSMQKNNMFLAAQVTSHLFSNVICIAKGYRLVFTVSDLQGTLQNLSDLWQKYISHRDIHGNIFKSANRTLLFCKLFMYATFGAVLNLCLPAIHNLIKEFLHKKDENYNHNFERRIFFFKYPFEVNSLLRYLFVMMQEGYLVVGAGMMWVASDVMFAQLTTHISLQLEVLQHDMEFLINRNISDHILKQSFNKIIKRHQILLRICSQVEYMFSPVILSTVLLSGINICFNVFEARETASKGNYTDASMHIFLFMITFLQILFYCSFAETLTQKTISVANGAYNLNWSEKNNVLGMYLQMLIIRSQNPFYFTAYGFFTIGHKQLTSIINGAFSYYMMLQASTK